LIALSQPRTLLLTFPRRSKSKSLGGAKKDARGSRKPPYRERKCRKMTYQQWHGGGASNTLFRYASKWSLVEQSRLDQHYHYELPLLKSSHQTQKEDLKDKLSLVVPISKNIVCRSDLAKGQWRHRRTISQPKLQVIRQCGHARNILSILFPDTQTPGAYNPQQTSLSIRRSKYSLMNAAESLGYRLQSSS
jgi:hypothetical protein